MAPEPRASRAASSTVPWWGKTEAGEAEVLKAIDRLEDELSEERGLLRERLILEAERHANDASAAAASTSSTATAATSEATLAAARKRRDAARRALQASKHKLSSMQSSRRDIMQKVQRRRGGAGAAAASPTRQGAASSSSTEEVPLPLPPRESVASFSSADEMRSLSKEVESLEAELERRAGIRLALQKVRNDKDDVERRLSAMREQTKETSRLLEVKRRELHALQGEQKLVHDVREVQEETIARLRKESNADMTARTSAEREADAMQKKLRRLRDALDDFLKRSVGVRGANQPLPLPTGDAPTNEMATLLADYIEQRHAAASGLERKVGASDAKLLEMEREASQAASELKRLNAKRERVMAEFAESATIKRELEQFLEMHPARDTLLHGSSPSKAKAAGSSSSKSPSPSSKGAGGMKHSVSLPAISNSRSPQATSKAKVG